MNHRGVTTFDGWIVIQNDLVKLFVHVCRPNHHATTFRMIWTLCPYQLPRDDGINNLLAYRRHNDTIHRSGGRAALAKVKSITAAR